MTAKDEEKPKEALHGRRELSTVIIDGYGDDVRTKDGYFGELVSNGAFKNLVHTVRDELAKSGGDPIGDEAPDITRRRIDKLLEQGDAQHAGVIFSIVEEFAHNVAKVVKSLIKLRDWSEVERIVVGGGFRESRVGELVIGRAGVLAREFKEGLQLMPIRHHPDEAGLIGAAHMFPRASLKGREHMLGVDIGGSNFRCGLVALNLDQDKELRKAEIVGHQLWRHAETETTLDDSMLRLAEMLRESLKYAEKNKLKVAPMIGVGVPGTVLEDGGLEGGVLNLPGDWKAPHFNLSSRIRQMIPEMSGEKTQVVIHNDAVAQGLSEAPFMTDVQTWAVLTIGTGLGNAVFRTKEVKQK